MTLLSEVEAGEPADDFYSRLCEATCRLTSMRRAVIFLYDDERRQVRAVGGPIEPRVEAAAQRHGRSDHRGRGNDPEGCEQRSAASGGHTRERCSKRAHEVI